MLRYIFIFFLLPVRLVSAQEFPYMDSLMHLNGYIHTYYTPGSEDKAHYLQHLLEDAVSFYESRLNDTFDLRLLVINREAWKYFAGDHFPICVYRRDPGRIIMPDIDLARFRLKKDHTLYGSNKAYFWDFVAVHELGHYISINQDARTHTPWLSEFFADFVQQGFMAERIPGYRYPKYGSLLWKIIPFQYKRLEDLHLSEESNPVNYIAYQVKFQELAWKIYSKRGMEFFDDHLAYFRELNQKARKEKKAYSREEIFAGSVTYLQEYEPEIFNKWMSTMKRSAHYYVVLVILLIPFAWSWYRKRYKFIHFFSATLLFLWISLFVVIRI